MNSELKWINKLEDFLFDDDQKFDDPIWKLYKLIDDPSRMSANDRGKRKQDAGGGGGDHRPKKKFWGDVSDVYMHA